MTTIREAKDELKKVGVTLTKRNGEFRVNLAGGSEATAYYTDDIEDAVATAMAMAPESTEMERKMEAIPMDIVCIEWRKTDEDTVKRLFFATNLTTGKMENVSKAEANRRLAKGAGLMRLGTMENPTNPPED